jgi:putative serine protease PepD
MSQTTNDQNDAQYAWARRPDEAAPTPTTTGASEPEAPRVEQTTSASAPTTTRPAYRPGETNPGYPYGGGSFYPPVGTADHGRDPAGGGFSPTAPAGRREPRRPGWTALVGVGVGAALLSSLLTAGIVSATDDDSGVATTAASSSVSPAVKAPVTSSSAGNPNWGAVAKAVEPSVVAVTVTGQSGQGEGSGVILDKTGRIVTNNHVVSGLGSGAAVTVTLSDGRGYKATVVGTDSATDLAVIKITTPPADLTPAVLGSSDSVAVGDAVMAVGNPLGLAGTVTTGIVSATDRPVKTESAESQEQQSPFGDPQGPASSGETVVTNAIQTDAAVNPGNSGGALVDAQGRVVGIPSSIASLGSSSAFGQSSQSGSIGLGFAIPIDEVKDVTDQLIKSGTVKHSWLGVSPQDGSVTVNGATRDAAVLKQIVSDSPAARAGLTVNDAVIAVDGDAVNSATSLVGQLRERAVGTSVTLTVVRDGKRSDIKVTLADRPTSVQ